MFYFALTPTTQLQLRHCSSVACAGCEHCGAGVHKARPSRGIRGHGSGTFLKFVSLKWHYSRILTARLSEIQGT